MAKSPVHTFSEILRSEEKASSQLERWTLLRAIAFLFDFDCLPLSFRMLRKPLEIIQVRH